MNWDLLIQLLVNGLIVGMLYGVVAMCFTLIYKSTQVVNFAQGEFLVLGAWVCWYFIVKWQLPFVAAFAFALVFTTLFGILVQVVILRPLVGEPVISVIMVTIGLSIFMQAVMNWAFGNNAVRFPNVFGSEKVTIAGLNVETAYLMSFALSLVIMIVFFYFFRYSRYGLAMRATAYSQQVAQSLGISVKQVFAMAWAISALVSCVAGVVLGLVNAVSNSLAIIGIKVFPAVIVGGLEFDRRRGGRRRHHRAVGELRGIHRRSVPADRQHVCRRPLLRAHHHPDDPPLRPVRHREHRADVTQEH